MVCNCGWGSYTLLCTPWELSFVFLSVISQLYLCTLNLHSLKHANNVVLSWVNIFYPPLHYIFGVLLYVQLLQASQAKLSSWTRRKAESPQLNQTARQQSVCTQNEGEVERFIFRDVLLLHPICVKYLGNKCTSFLMCNWECKLGHWLSIKPMSCFCVVPLETCRALAVRRSNNDVPLRCR